MTAFTSNLDYAPSAPTIVTRIVAAINAAVARAALPLCRGGDRPPLAPHPRRGRPGRHRSDGAWRSR